MITTIFLFLYCTTKIYSTDLDGSIQEYKIDVVKIQSYQERTPPQQMPGWPKTISTHPNYKPSGISLADINNDGKIDIIVASYNRVYVWDYEGNDLPGWPINLPTTIQSKVAIGDIDNNGDLEIVIAGRDGKVYIYNHNGTAFPNWPQNANGVLGLISPTLFDLDRDGDLEIIMPQMQSGQPGHIYIWHHDGQLFSGWPQNTDYLAVATAAVADIDQDSLFEIVALSYRSVYVWDQNGNLEPGWPKLNVASGMSYAQPILADLNNDGYIEVLHAYYLNSQNYVGIYDYSGTNFTGWPQTYPGPQTYTTPVTADINNDQYYEIFGGGHVMSSPDLLARAHSGSQITGWPVTVDMLECSPIVLDLNDDGIQEVLVADNVSPGNFYCYKGDGSILPDWPVATTAAALVNSPAAADVDQDGDIEVALIVADGTVNLWTIESIPYRGYLTEWTTFFHDLWNTGWLHPKPPQNLTVSETGQGAQLYWDPAPEPDIAGYNIYRSTNSGGPYDRLNDSLITITSYFDNPDTLGQYYFYCVTAMTRAMAESHLSNEDSAWVGIQENTGKISPENFLVSNPLRNKLIFNLPDKIHNWTVNIYNAHGVLIKTLSGVKIIKWQPESSLSNGIYFAAFSRDSQKQIIKKIVYLK